MFENKAQGLYTMLSTYLVNLIDIGEVVKADVEIIEHVDNVNGCHRGSNVGKGDNVTEQDGTGCKLFCQQNTTN